MGGRHRYGVDHGLTFHSEHKLRSVLWGWIGEAMSAEELEGVGRVLEGLQGELGRDLAKLLTAEEIASLAARCARLRSAVQFPAPSGGMPAVPWPLFSKELFRPCPRVGGARRGGSSGPENPW